MSPIGGNVVAAIGLGVGIAAIVGDAITSPVAVPPAAMAVAIAPVAVVDVVSGGVAEGCGPTFETMKPALLIDTMGAGRAIETRVPRRSTGTTVNRTTFESQFADQGPFIKVGRIGHGGNGHADLIYTHYTV
jgi:hypothetical protein